MRSYAVTHPAGTVVPPQPPGWRQVLFASAGAITVEVPEGSWFVPPGAAVDVPAGTPHRIRAASRTRLRNLYLRGSTVERAQVIAVSPLLRELVLAAVDRAPLYRGTDPAAERLAALLEQELADAEPVEPLLLPLPRDAVSRRVADRVLADPGEPGGTDALCRGCGAGRRTVERRFREETGLGVAQWRRRARLAAALEALARGEPAARVAARVGYATPSAFGAMVRAELGTTPGALAGT